MNEEEKLLQKWVTEKFGGIEYLLTNYNSESMVEFANFYHKKKMARKLSDWKDRSDAHKECFEKFIPIDKWDEATDFLSKHGKVAANKLRD